MTIPTGFVKSTIQASGAAPPRRRRSASSRTTGTVRSALAKPPGAGRLLADQPNAVRQRLVDESRGLAADPQLDEDERRAVDGRVAVGRC